MIRLLMFDLDGTLVDSSVDITNALNYATEPYDFGRITPDRTITLVGEGITRLIEKLVVEERAGIVPDVLDRFSRYYSDHLADFTLPYQGVSETLEKLSGYRKAVISNKREAMSRKLLDKIGLLRYFDMVVGGDSAEERKPSPMPLRKALDAFGVTPREAVMVGDSNYDIEAGRAAGVRTVAVTYGFRRVEYLRDADHIIASFGELAPLLAAIGGDEGRR